MVKFFMEAEEKNPSLEALISEINENLGLLESSLAEGSATPYEYPAEIMLELAEFLNALDEQSIVVFIEDNQESLQKIFKNANHQIVQQFFDNLEYNRRELLKM